MQSLVELCFTQYPTGVVKTEDVSSICTYVYGVKSGPILLWLCLNEQGHNCTPGAALLFHTILGREGREREGTGEGCVYGGIIVPSPI